VSDADVQTGSRQVFSPRNVIALIVVGVVAFSAFLTLLAYAPDVQRDVRCRANVYSVCAIGYAGLAALVRDEGTPTLVSRAKLPANHTEGLLVVTLEPGGDADVAGLGFGGPVLVVLPKWNVQPDPLRISWGRKVGLLDPSDMPQKDLVAGLRIGRRSGVAQPRLTADPGSLLGREPLTPGPIDSLQTMTLPDGWRADVTDEAGQVLIARPPNSDIYVLSDPDLLNTQGLANVDTFGAAVSLVRQLRAGEGPVIFDVTLNGYKVDRSALKLMFDPPFVAVTLCIVAAMVLAGLQALVRFGAVRRAGRVFALGKEALTDNSAQLIRLAKREPKMAPRYAALTRAIATKAVAAPRDLAGPQLDAFLDRMGAQRGAQGRLADLVAEADRVSDRPGLTALAQKLYRWRLEMTRERH